MAELSVLIVNYNSWDVCAHAIASLRQNGPTRPDGSPMPFECVVVDNLSPSRSPERIAQLEHELRLLAEQQGDPQSGRLILHTENGGYSKGMNLAFAHARGRWILVSNPDLVFSPGLLPALQRQLENDPTAGIAVPRGFFDPGHEGNLPPNTMPDRFDLVAVLLGEYSVRVQRWYSRRLTRRWLATWQCQGPLALPMMSGAMFLIERAFFERIGKFDERYPLYYEDADLSKTILKHGRRIVQVPDAKMAHFVNRSGMTDSNLVWTRHAVSRAAFYRKWYGRFGAWLLRVTTKWMTSERLQKKRRFRHLEPHTDLGNSQDPPVLRFGRHVERFLVLLSPDRRMYLAAGMIGSGDHWTPSPTMFRVFVGAHYEFLAYDISDGTLRPLGSWSYRCLMHLGHPAPLPAAAPAADPAAGTAAGAAT